MAISNSTRSKDNTNQEHSMAYCSVMVGKVPLNNLAVWNSPDVQLTWKLSDWV